MQSIWGVLWTDGASIAMKIVIVCWIVTMVLMGWRLFARSAGVRAMLWLAVAGIAIALVAIVSIGGFRPPVWFNETVAE